MFQACYAPTVTGLGAVLWQRVALPRAGGIADQPAWLLAAFDHLQQVYTRISGDRLKVAAAARRRAKDTARRG